MQNNFKSIVKDKFHELTNVNESKITKERFEDMITFQNTLSKQEVEEIPQIILD